MLVKNSCHYYSFSPMSIQLGLIHIIALWDLTLSSLLQQIPGGSQSCTCVLFTLPWNNRNPGIYLPNKLSYWKQTTMLMLFPISPLRDTPSPVVVCRQLPKCWAELVQNLLQFGLVLTTPGWFRCCTGKDDSCLDLRCSPPTLPL